MKTLTVFFFITIVMVINACNRPPATNYADFMTTKNIQLDEHNISALLGMPGDMISAFANPKYLDDRINIYGAHATSKFRPILDSSLVCSRYKTWFYIVEQMPRPKITTYEIENILKNEVRFNDQELSSNDTIYFQCVVNCIGKAGDYQILKCPNELVNIGCQVRNVLKIHFTDWEPPVQRGENVDLLALLVVIINNGHFEVVGHWNYGNHN